MSDYVLEDCRQEYLEQLEYERQTYGRELTEDERWRFEYENNGRND